MHISQVVDKVPSLQYVTRSCKVLLSQIPFPFSIRSTVYSFNYMRATCGFRIRPQEIDLFGRGGAI